jgi:hypothetical protein
MTNAHDPYLRSARPVDLVGRSSRLALRAMPPTQASCRRAHQHDPHTSCILASGQPLLAGQKDGPHAQSVTSIASHWPRGGVSDEAITVSLLGPAEHAHRTFRGPRDNAASGGEPREESEVDIPTPSSLLGASAYSPGRLTPASRRNFLSVHVARWGADCGASGPGAIEGSV